MNENLNLVKILKDCPKGTKLYSTVFGEVEFDHIEHNTTYPIITKSKPYGIDRSSIDGKRFFDCGECVLFPSKEQRDWSKFNPNKEKKEMKKRFDPKTLQPFDKVLALEDEEEDAIWFADFISQPYNESTKFIFVIGSENNCITIPYNDETKHLIGTQDKAPEYYRYWED